MGAKTVVKRQNIALLDRSKVILARHKRPENAPYYDRWHKMDLFFSAKIQIDVQTMGTRWYQAPEKLK